MQSVKTDWNKIATEVKSSNIVEEYDWLGDFPKMREWVGDREIKDLTAYSYSLSKKDWELTIEVDRDYIEFDKLGLIVPRVQNLAYESATHYDEIVFSLLESNGLCYDGEAFFSSNHIFGKEVDGVTDKVYSNIGTKSLTQDNLLSEVTEMALIKSDSGKPLRIRPTLLVIPPALEGVARRLLLADTINNETNMTKGMMDYLVVPHLSSSSGWYLFDTSRPLKPFILQITRAMKFSAMDTPADESVFMRKKFRYGVDSMDTAGYGLWQLARYNDGTA